jgi:hypothetical protein
LSMTTFLLGNFGWNKTEQNGWSKFLDKKPLIALAVQ